ncbi:3-hydroxyacyl-CoA dehydrogenase NAD-binding domain-containing protein [Terasakiella pusilla]|uniref:3-hydroxyacyl-CoA dehydrogenase/enoyl-CoA hydratase family protein n=1 Tax=Terasakiella pusilla TaxID=64973 RepID=UPI003AA86EB9
MAHSIQKVGVIGAGVMGAGIAAQAANGGATVVLLDIVPDGVEDRDAIAKGARERFLKAGANGGFMGTEAANRLSVGNTEDHMDLLSDCDWIVEVIVERLDIKQDLFKRIEAVRKDGSIVSSNTSTIPLKNLMDGMPERLRTDFIVTHYFNPPRHMRLLEIVKGEDTQQSAVDRVAEFNDVHMGKTVIHCADRPGFIANRLGVFWMQAAVYEAQRNALSIEDADAIMSGPCGYPSTGIFGLWDLCGINLMPDVTASLASNLPETDAFKPYKDVMPEVIEMVEKGYHGRKGRVYQGFYRVTKTDDGKRFKETIQLDTLDYKPFEKSTLASTQLKKGQLKDLITSTDKGGIYGWKVLSQVLSYATTLVPDVAGDITSVDKAMKLGYNWAFGPFEMIDLIGTDIFVARLEADGLPVSDFLKKADGRALYITENGVEKCLNANGEYETVAQADGVMTLADLVRANALVSKTDNLNIWDLGDDVWCLEFRTKMNTLPKDMLQDIDATVKQAEQAGKAIVLYNEGPVFAAGANLADLIEKVEDRAFVEDYIAYGQQVFMRLKNASVPIVGAPAGRAFGGGVEILLHCHAVQAHSELYIGLVENNVGIIPAWGGTKELLIRSMEALGKDNAIAHTYKVIQGAMVSGSALHAQELCYLRPTDGITMNRDRLLMDAKKRALELRKNPFKPTTLPALPKPQDPAFSEEGYQATLERTTFDTMLASDHDGWEEGLLARELKNVLSLCGQPQAIARMQHMLKTGKPLKN